MTSNQTNNIIINLNETKDNIEYLNKAPKIHFNSLLIQNSTNSPKNIYFSPNLTTNVINQDLSTVTVAKNEKLKKKFTTTQSKSNLKFKSSKDINIPKNSNKDLSLIESDIFNSNLEYLNNDNINNQNKSYQSFQSNNNNKLIEPKFFDDSCDIQDSVYINNPIRDINHIRIKFRESARFKDRNIFNKFKVFHCKPKITREKLSSKLRHKRKYKPDDIRKKIKARFHKSIKNIINENLRQAGSKYFFSFLPQIFISSIARDKNHQVLNLSYREIIQKDFISNIDEKKYKNKNVDLAKYKNNLNVLEYLDKNPEICENSGFDIISNMKYSDLLDEYFKSAEFEKAVRKLHEENEEEEYIREYIKKAKNYVNFFSEVPFKINNKKNKKNIENLTVEIQNNEKNKEKEN